MCWGAVWAALEKLVGKEQGDFGQEGVSDDDEDGREDSGLCSSAADALRASAHGQAFVTTDRGEDKGKKDGLGESLHDVRKIEGIDGAAPELDGAETEGKNGSDAAAEQSGEIDHGRQQGEREESSDGPWRHQLTNGIGAHGAHGVHLFGDQHRAELGSDSRRTSAGHQQTREGWPQFADERDGHDVARQRTLAKARKLRTGLQNHDRANEKPAKQDDGERAGADAVHLLQNVLEVIRRSDDSVECATAEYGVVLDVRDSAF